MVHSESKPAPVPSCGYFLVHPAARKTSQPIEKRAQGFSNLVPWCSRGSLGAGRWESVERVGGTGSWAPHTPEPDLLPFLLSLEIQSVQSAGVGVGVIQ